MFTVDKTIPVNTGEKPDLTGSDVWRGLVLKGENALPFVPIMEACGVIERGDNWLIREIRIAGNTMREKVTFQPEHTVEFERLDGIERGTILNEVLTDGDLQLRFTFTLSREDLEDGSDEELAYANSMEGTYLKAVQSTIDTIRRLVSEGELAAE
ncbi:MAG: SRPBCC family protein [Alphaproteobacteria bacterium]